MRRLNLFGAAGCSAILVPNVNGRPVSTRVPRPQLTVVMMRDDAC